jgi:hypothetical protein
LGDRAHGRCSGDGTSGGGQAAATGRCAQYLDDNPIRRLAGGGRLVCRLQPAERHCAIRHAHQNLGAVPAARRRPADRAGVRICQWLHDTANAGSWWRTKPRGSPISSARPAGRWRSWWRQRVLSIQASCVPSTCCAGRRRIVSSASPIFIVSWSRANSSTTRTTRASEWPGTWRTNRRRQTVTLCWHWRWGCHPACGAQSLSGAGHLGLPIGWRRGPGVGGFEYRLANSWSVFAEGKLSYSHLDTDLEGGGQLKTYLWSPQLPAGISYRFVE